MKTGKKLLALILAICMLIGMPLSLDVAAADTTGITVADAHMAGDTQLFLRFSMRIKNTGKHTLRTYIVNEDGKIVYKASISIRNNGYVCPPIA